jgi:hypothetical protein
MSALFGVLDSFPTETWLLFSAQGNATRAAWRQSELPFLIAQLMVAAIFIVLGFLAARRFHPEALQGIATYPSVPQSTKR